MNRESDAERIKQLEEEVKTQQLKDSEERRISGLEKERRKEEALELLDAARAKIMEIDG
jgi:hypothetical protein